MSEQPSTFDISNTQQPTVVTELVGEGKKYKTMDDLARSRIEADSFIEKLKVENKALREALDTDGSPDEVLAKINSLLQSKTTGSENTTDQKSNQPPKESLSKQEVLELLSEQRRTEKLDGNVKQFNNAVNKAFGEKTAEVISTRLGELGMEQETFRDLAARNPQAALRILGLREGGVVGGPVDSSVNTEAYFGPAGKGNGETQNFEYFQKIRRELGSAYYEPAIQKQVFEARKKMGDAFWKK